MSSNWTSEQIIALAPDSSSANAGRGLANLAKWVSTGFDDKTVWGECQGSGKNPYQVVIDLSEPAFKCTCPSRKFPCKHGIALFLLFATKQVKPNPPPNFAAEWLSKRQDSQERKQEKSNAIETPEETVKREKSRAKRANERETKVAAGLRELELWLKDLVRNGLATAQTQPVTYWEKTAKRLVDAQSSGIAQMVREMSGIAHGGDNWTEKLLEQIGKTFLLCDSYKRIESLPEPIRADVRANIGWTIKEDELANIETEIIRDDWQILGQKTYEEDKLRVQRTWLYGEKSKRDAMVLSFAFLNQPHNISLIVGSQIGAALKFYPSNLPLRAIISERHESKRNIENFIGHKDFAEFSNFTTDALSKNVWLKMLPARLENVVVIRNEKRWFVRDMQGKTLQLNTSFASGDFYGCGWEMLAISGGEPINMFGEWDGETLFPLNVWMGNKLFGV